VIGIVYLAQYIQSHIFRNTVGQNPPLMYSKYGKSPYNRLLIVM